MCFLLLKGLGWVEKVMFVYSKGKLYVVVEGSRSAEVLKTIK